MNRQMIVGNWKMNGATEAARALVAGLVDRMPENTADVVICPPFPYLASVAGQLAGSRIGLGAQGFLAAAGGAYTGHGSGPVLADVRPFFTS